MKLWVTWWSTWWHVTPITSLIIYIHQQRKFKDKVSQIYRFWETDSLEQKAADWNAIFVPIKSWKIRRSRYYIWSNTIDILQCTWWTLQLIFDFPKIDVLFSKWWYVSLPATIAAWVHHIPILVHESDTCAGLSTRIASYLATHVCTGFDWVLKNAETVWQILNPNLRYTPSHDTTTHVLVNGWSQWSESLYRLAQTLAQHNPEMHFHVINWFRNIYQGTLYDNLTVYNFWWAEQMWKLYSLCDRSITRWWVTSLQEQHIFGIKMIMIPLDITHDQYHNCMHYTQFGHILIPQKPGREEICLHTLINYKKPTHVPDLGQWADRVATILIDLGVAHLSKTKESDVLAKNDE